jgi:uncharacterized protein
VTSSAGLLTVGVADLLRRPGSRRELKAEVPAGSIRVGEVEVPTGATIRCDLALESLSDGLVVTGRVRAPWSGPCRRCLETVEGEVDAELREVFERVAVEGETWPLEGDHVDLAPVVREAVVLALPLAPLCRPDCIGPDPDRFPAHAAGTVEADEADEAAAEGDHEQPEQPPKDPRWAKLDELRFDR